MELHARRESRAIGLSAHRGRLSPDFRRPHWLSGLSLHQGSRPSELGTGERGGRLPTEPPEQLPECHAQLRLQVTSTPSSQKKRRESTPPPTVRRVREVHGHFPFFHEPQEQHEPPRVRPTLKCLAGSAGASFLQCGGFRRLGVTPWLAAARRRPMLPRQPRLTRPNIRVESRNRRRRSLRTRAPRQEHNRHPETNHEPAFHEEHRAPPNPPEQCTVPRL